MKTVRILYHLARADFHERTRRYSFLVMLGLVLWVGYVMASGQFRMSIGLDYAGVIDSAWVGATMALTTSFVVGLVGFYIVKGSVARDYATGVGQIMATTPMSRALYMLGKWLSNYAVLGITIVIVALAGMGMTLWFGSGGLDLVALLTPLVLLGLPWLGLVAALAVLFESAAWLRGGLGNVVYLVLWLILVVATVAAATEWTPGARINPYVDPTGIRIIGDSVSTSGHAAYPDAAGFSFGIPPKNAEFKLFPYNGIQWTASILVSRLLLLLVAVGLVLLAGVLFDRFDPARLLPVKRRAAAPEPAPAPVAEPVPVSSTRLTSLSGAETRFRFRALLSAELKLAIKAQRWWWYAVAAGLVVAQLVSPSDYAAYVLIAAWVWPTLILSGLGCRENQFDTRQIVFSAPRPMGQLPAGWLSAVLVTALLGCGALVRFLLAGDPAAVFGWLTAVLFIPSLALALGTLTGSGKAFEVLYVVWMYGLIEQVPALDFAGLVPGSPFYLYAPVTIGLLAIAALARRWQLQAT
jgi:ABC-type transport system involved in multi-copper enzyme maturation permease subunit